MCQGPFFRRATFSGSSRTGPGFQDDTSSQSARRISPLPVPSGSCTVRCAGSRGAVNVGSVRIGTFVRGALRWKVFFVVVGVSLRSDPKISSALVAVEQRIGSEWLASSVWSAEPAGERHAMDRGGQARAGVSRVPGSRRTGVPRA